MVPYFATPGIHLPGNVNIKSPITGTNPNLAQIGLQGTALKELIKRQNLLLYIFIWSIHLEHLLTIGVILY